MQALICNKKFLKSDCFTALLFKGTVWEWRVEPAVVAEARMEPD